MLDYHFNMRLIHVNMLDYYVNMHMRLIYVSMLDKLCQNARLLC